MHISLRNRNLLKTYQGKWSIIMSILFIDENGAVVTKNGNRIVVQYKDDSSKSLPVETLESIVILGSVQLTTQCMEECLTRGIPVAFFSKGGKYFGRFQSTSHTNAERQRMQSGLYHQPFALDFAKIIISAKLKNQIVVLRRYTKDHDESTIDCIQALINCRKKIESCENITSLLGYEGQGAKAYFKGLSLVIEKDFSFSGRSRRPPLDEFNAMISLGYTILMNEIVAAIEMKGMNPYFGFMHRDHENHPTLASDLLEEWRAVLVDSTVMSLINGHEIHKEDYLFNPENQGCYLTKKGLRVFLNKFNKKLQTKTKYIPSVDFPVTFRQGIALQINTLSHAIECSDASFYKPVEIR